MDWQELEGLCLSDFERGMLREMDCAYRVNIAKKRAEVQAREAAK